MYVTSANAHNASGNSVQTLTLTGYTPTVGNVVCLVLGANHLITGPGVSSTGNTFNPHPQNGTNGWNFSANYTIAAWSCVIAQASGITVNWTTSSAATIIALEFSGRNTVTPIDATNFGVDAAGTLNHNCGSVTTNQAGDDIVCLSVANTSAAQTITAGNTPAWNLANSVAAAGLITALGEYINDGLTNTSYAGTWTSTVTEIAAGLFYAVAPAAAGNNAPIMWVSA